MYDCYIELTDLIRYYEFLDDTIECIEIYTTDLSCGNYNSVNDYELKLIDNEKIMLTSTCSNVDETLSLINSEEFKEGLLSRIKKDCDKINFFNNKLNCILN